MQDELIQIVKLVVVGQMMIILVYEINQLLNVLLMYFFMVGRVIEQGQVEQVWMMLSKVEGLINCIDVIICFLCQFICCVELEMLLYLVDLCQMFIVVWELLVMCYKFQQGMLVILDDIVWIQGDEVCVYQVLVNVLFNVFDVCLYVV